LGGADRTQARNAPSTGRGWASPSSSKHCNISAYVLNNPLSYVDPSGFEPEKPPILPIREVHRRDDSGGIHITLIYPPREGASPVESTLREAEQVGAAASPTDVDTTGSSAGYASQPVTTTPEDWTQHPLVQVEGGFIGGLALGRVPFGSVVAGAITGPGSRWAEIGRGVGEIVGGGLAFAAGMTGMFGGGAASLTGVGTVPGVLAVVGSAALVAGGIANVKAGAERLGQALSMSSGSGSSGPQGPPPAAGTGGQPSRALGRALESAGHARPPGSAAHHIVAHSARDAAPARGVLQKFGININEAANGVFLPSAQHSALHTQEYYTRVNTALTSATTREQAINALQSIGQALQSGTFP